MKTILIPGLYGSEPEHWQRYWEREDAAAEVVEQEDWHRPVLSAWLTALEAHLAAAPGAVLVAHSLACPLVAHLAGRPAAAHVAGALLVAPADAARLGAHDAQIAAFAAFPNASLPFPSIVVASRNDPYMPFEAAKAHAALWGSGFVDLGEAGHINVASGFGRWRDGPVLRDALAGVTGGTVRSGLPAGPAFPHAASAFLPPAAAL